MADLKPRHDDLLSQKVELTSGIAEMSRSLSDAQALVSELRSRLAESEEDKKRKQFENERLLADQTRANVVIRELREQRSASEQRQQELITEMDGVRQRRDELRLMLDDQATKAEQWYSKAKDLEQQIEQLQQRQSPLSSPPIAQGEPLVADNEPQDRTGAGRPPVVESEPAVEEVIAPEETPHLTREQLGKQFKVSRETIRKWELSGSLKKRGWVQVLGTGTSPTNPRLYQED